MWKFRRTVPVSVPFGVGQTSPVTRGRPSPHAALVRRTRNIARNSAPRLGRPTVTTTTTTKTNFVVVRSRPRPTRPFRRHRRIRPWYERGACRTWWHPVSGDNHGGGDLPDGRRSIPPTAWRLPAPVHRRAIPGPLYRRRPNPPHGLSRPADTVIRRTLSASFPRRYTVTGTPASRNIARDPSPVSPFGHPNETTFPVPSVQTADRVSPRPFHSTLPKVYTTEQYTRIGA